MWLQVVQRPLWPIGKVAASRSEGSRFQTRFHLRSAVYEDLVQPKSYEGAKGPPAGVMRKFGEGEPAQVSSSSSDHGSKLRGLSQNSPRVDSKQRVRIV
ncbi:hypothetical protein AVEN_155064-1 [Araneus ventricosus]|uniref:Uncharacterized protein n=1 Tax=Araneus ventricosus TaxID=182803 RepID=A0A4Y2A7G4_ARAVE|nr:hypothetical protein AVEN_155064-1 [Araneus ventricosus]